MQNEPVLQKWERNLAWKDDNAKYFGYIFLPPRRRHWNLLGGGENSASL